MNYKNAFNCKKCPECNTEAGCPMWWEFMQTNDHGQERLQKMCGYQALPMFMVEVIKASNRPAAAIEKTRNDLVAGLGNISHVIRESIVPDLLMNEQERIPLLNVNTDE
jgi:hypothetical protein